ncbi:ABC transporter permease, partial [Paenibacillus sp.]|uniref:ABC transporter permease n=1 Tax=Paenibacillus sp. TaxID=58172 RepID=UPI0034645522
MHNLGTVIRFTLKTKMMTKSFVITTIILALIMTVGVNIPFLISQFSSNEPTSIGLVQGGDYAEIAKSFEEQLTKHGSSDLKLVPSASEEELRKKVDSGDLEGYLKFDPKKDAAGNVEKQAFPQVVFHGKDELGHGDEATVTGGLSAVKTEWLVKDSLTEQQKAELSKPVTIDTQKIVKEGEKATEENPMQKGISIIVVMVLIVLFFMTNTMTGNMIASEVTQEKSSRIMEILITSVSPLAQMFGKIIGMFLLGLMQIIVFFAVVVINLLLPHNAAPLKDLNFDISMIDWTVVGGGLLLYVLGYFLYATLFAAVGSIVSRTEDLAQAAMPISLLTMAAFYIAIFSVSTPNTLLVKVSSYIPFFTPTSMLLRIGTDSAAWWEFWVSIAILIVS